MNSKRKTISRDNRNLEVYHSRFREKRFVINPKGKLQFLTKLDKRSIEKCNDASVQKDITYATDVPSSPTFCTD